MQEYLTKDFSGKIFSLEDLERIDREVLIIKKNLYELQPNDYLRHKINVKCKDNTTYETEDFEKLKNEGIFHFKNIEEIEFVLSNFTIGYYLRVNISVKNKSVIEVNSTNREWNKAVFSRFYEYIEDVKPQYNFVSMKNIFFHVLALAVGYVGQSFIGFLFASNSAPSNRFNLSEDIRIILLVFIYWLNGVLWLYISKSAFLYIWPSIEFDFGPDYKLSYKKIRKWSSFIIVGVAIPIIVSLFVSFIQ